MNKVTVTLLAGALVAGSIWLGQASAAPVGGTMTRANNFAPAERDPDPLGTCFSSSNGGGTVQADANLNTSGANLNVSPGGIVGACTTVTRAHKTQMVASCFTTGSYNQTKNGASGNRTAADHLFDCSARGGGSGNMYYLEAL